VTVTGVSASRERPLSLSEVVARSAVPASTVHHYLRAGLIPPPTRCAPNRFSYDERHVTALRLIRILRDRRGLGLDEIAAQLPELLRRPNLAGRLAEVDPDGESDVAGRLVASAIDAFGRRSYRDVTVADIADAAGVGKGSVYRYFASKEELFTAAVETVLTDTAADFSAAVERLGGADGMAASPREAAIEFANLVAGSMPLLLELGARAAKGHRPSQDLARRVLRTLATAAGQPLTPGSRSVAATASAESGAPAPSGFGPGPAIAAASAPGPDPIPAGLAVIQEAFAVVLQWAVGTDWPPRRRRRAGRPAASPRAR
jgi:AcrR family transcriptional regulator